MEAEFALRRLVTALHAIDACGLTRVTECVQFEIISADEHGKEFRSALAVADRVLQELDAIRQARPLRKL
jgi:hypothetical protein